MKGIACFSLLFLLFLQSCDIFKGAGTSNPYKDNLLGEWILKSMKQGEKTITSDKFGGKASIQFFENGKIITRFPNQKPTTSQYFLEGNKIIDMGSNEGKSMEIVKLEGRELILKMGVDRLDKVQMRFQKQ